MRILLIHAEEFSYETTSKAIKRIEEKPGIPHSGEYRNALVVFTTIEEDDEEDIIDEAINEILDVANRVKPEHIILYPYAHLSNNLAKPSKALQILEKLYEELREKSSIKTHRAPFGYYKKFILKCYGHPLSELSKTIRRKKEAITKQIERGEFYIVVPAGKLFSIEEFNYEKHSDLKNLVDTLVYGRGTRDKHNRVEDYCGKLGIKWLKNELEGFTYLDTNGVLIYELIKQYVINLAYRIGIPLKTIYLPPLEEEPNYTSDHGLLSVETGRKKLYLRNTCSNRHLLKNIDIRENKSPLGFFEVANIFRIEDRNKHTLCLRQNNFTLPCIHIVLKELEDLWRIIEKIQGIILGEAAKHSQKMIPYYRLSKNMWNDHRDSISMLIEQYGEPALLELTDNIMFSVGYYIVDHRGIPVKISSISLEEDNSLYILHAAPIGSIERYLYMILDSAAKLERSGRTPYIPTWLSPIQVRLIPIKGEYIEYAESIANKLLEKEIRVDIDDRGIGLGRRIRDAGKSWIPYIVVIGEREVKSNTLNIRVRRTNDQVVMHIEEFIEYLDKELKDYPRIKQYHPLRVSDRV